MSSTQSIIILKTFKNLFGCKIVSATNIHYPDNIQNFFRLQNCLSRKPPLSWKYSKTFCLQNCLSRKSSLSWKYSKTFSPAKLSWPQIIFILKMFKGLFACKVVFDANHHYPENIQGLFRLQNCLSRNSSFPWEVSKTFSPANLSYIQIIIILKYSKTFSRANLPYPQIITILKIFKNILASKIALAANHHYPENIQRLFRLQNRLRRKSSLCWNYS